MPRNTAQTRVRSGQVNATTLTIDRPETQVRGPNGDVFTIPRRPAVAEVPVYRKVNSNLVDPKSGQRLQPGKRSIPQPAGPRTISFGAVALTAFIGFRVLQLLQKCFRHQSPGVQQVQQQQRLFLQQQMEQQQLPRVRVFPAMLQRALPTLGPPSRVKRIAQQHRNRQRRLPSARQKLQQRGVVQKRATTLEKWDKAVKQQSQSHALMVRQGEQVQQGDEQAAPQQLSCGRSSAVLPLPGLPGSSLVPPQLLLEVAEVQQ